MNRATAALCALVLAQASPTAATQRFRCALGQRVVDRENKIGVIVAIRNHLCRVAYPDGEAYPWIDWDLHPAGPQARAGPAIPAADALPKQPETVTILRPETPHTLVFQADKNGQFSLEAAVNDAPIHFLVDTGASLVTLNLADAETVGISPGTLAFSGISQTANGRVRFAPVMLREIRIGPLSIDNVPAAVIENSAVSVLGMSFLQRLKSFEMRGGALTIDW